MDEKSRTGGFDQRFPNSARSVELSPIGFCLSSHFER